VTVLLQFARLNEHRPPVILQFSNRLPHVIQREVPRLLAHPGQDVRRPASRKFLERADVEVAVVKEPLQTRHLPVQKPPVLADAVAAHRRRTGLDVNLQKLECKLLGLHCRDDAASDAFKQTGGTVGRSIPVVHCVQHGVGLVDRDDRAFGDDLQLRIGHDRRDFDDAVPVRVEARHLQVDPNEVFRPSGHER